MSHPPIASSVWLLLVGADLDLRAITQEAAQRAFSDARVLSAESVEDAAQMTSGAAIDTPLLILFGRSDNEGLQARLATSATGLPRWAVVTCGVATGEDAWLSIAPRDWAAPLVARVLQAAAALHRVRCHDARCRGDLLSIGTRIAHDLRSPLGGVLTTGEVLREVLAEELPTKSRLADPVIDSADEMIKLIRQLSLFAKASAEGNGLVPLNMGEPFWAALQKIEKGLLAKKATVAQAKTWPDVAGNAVWLEAVWHILLGNALAHSGATPRIEAGWDESSAGRRFWLRDEGNVPLEKRNKLFHPFHLLHQPNAPRGLGLPIAQRLVELQGGRCGYEPIPEGGSRFFFVLPMGLGTQP
jgi:K+-sensing histidine kinase KdpD